MQSEADKETFASHFIDMRINVRFIKIKFSFSN